MKKNLMIQLFSVLTLYTLIITLPELIIFPLYFYTYLSFVLLSLDIHMHALSNIHFLSVSRLILSPAVPSECQSEPLV